MSSTVMNEQTSLVSVTANDPVWLDRLIDDDPVARLGETFVLNSHTSPTSSFVTRNIHPEARLRTGEWLRDSLVNPDERSLRVSPVEGDPRRIDSDALARITGLPRDGFPAAFSDWRLGVEVYILVGRDIYFLLDKDAMPYRRLTDAELGELWSGRCFPFLEAESDGIDMGVQVWLVAVPARLAALGGLRGVRTALLDAGRAMGHLSAVDPTSTWTTEFYDDAVSRLLGIDGVERCALAVGMRREGASDDVDNT